MFLRMRYFVVAKSCSLLFSDLSCTFLFSATFSVLIRCSSVQEKVFFNYLFRSVIRIANLAWSYYFQSSVKLHIGELLSEAHRRVETSRIMCCILFLFNFLCRCNTMSLYFIFVVQTERKNSLLPFKEVSPSQFTLALVSIVDREEKDSFISLPLLRTWFEIIISAQAWSKRTSIDRSTRWRV